MEDLLKNKVFAHTFAAASSVALGTALTYPLDTVKVLVQVGSSSSKQLAPSKAFETVRYLSGNLAFGRIFGLGARFGIYEVLTAFCKEDNVGLLCPLAVSLAAGFSGSVAAAASHGFDTAKCRSQCLVLPKFLLMENKLLKLGQSSSKFERLTQIHPADRKILSNGIWLQMARSGFASFFIVGCYYLSVDLLVKRGLLN